MRPPTYSSPTTSTGRARQTSSGDGLAGCPRGLLRKEASASRNPEDRLESRIDFDLAGGDYAVMRGLLRAAVQTGHLALGEDLWG